MKRFGFAFILVLTGISLSGCMEDFVRKEEFQALEASMTRRLNSLNYDLNITKGATNENRSAIEVLQQQIEEVSKRLGMINENIEQVGGLETKFNKRLKTMMDVVVKENERLIKEINKTRDSGASSSTGSGSGKDKGSTIYKKSDKKDFGKGFTHTVGIGENISKIAKKYQVPIEDILNANNLDNPDSLYIGQELFIPSDQPKPE